MKKILCVLILVSVISAALVSCGIGVPRPEVKEGQFDITVTYEQDGEVKEASAVYVCEYAGIAWSLEGHPYVKWKEHFEGDISDGGVLSICNTEDGGEILISLLVHPEYFMGDPAFANSTPIVRAEIFYEDREIDDAEIIAEYGVRLIGCEYDEPIENSFK